MAGVKGNKNALGNKGGGRKPLPVEMAMRKKEEELLYEVQDVEEVQKRIKQKKYSVRDAMLVKELTGNEAFISRHYHKVVPDKVELDEFLTIQEPIYAGRSISTNNRNRKAVPNEKKDS